MRLIHCSAWGVTVVLVSVLVVIPVRADLALDTDVTVRYESNVWLFSKAERRAFEATPASAAFRGVESLDDFSVTPVLGLAWRPDTGPWRYRLIGAAERFVRNSRLDNEEIFADVRRNLGKSDHVRASLAYSPNTFVGESRRGTLNINDEFVSSVTGGVTYSHRVNRDNRVLIAGTTARENYTEGFDDQDSWLYSLRVTWYRRLAPRWIVKAAGWIRRRDSDQLVAPAGDGRDAVFNDISSESYRADAEMQYRINNATAVSGGMMYVYRRYTTDSADDLNHFGRVDRSYRVVARLLRRLGERWDGSMDFSYIERDSNLDPASFEYETWSASINFAYRF